MKYIKTLLLSSILSTVLLLSACTNNNSQPEETTTQVTEWTATTAAPTVIPTDPTIKIKEQKATVATKKATEATETTTEAPLHTQGVENPNGHIPVTTVKGSFKSSDLEFIYEDATIKLNDKIENIFEAIGEDNISAEISDTQMEYQYEDFTLCTYINEKDVEKLEKIIISNKSLSTPKGVKIGDYASQLRRVYGDPIERKNGAYYYGTATKQLIFGYENNLITQITYQYYPQ